jgi:hypothetical protein
MITRINIESELYQDYDDFHPGELFWFLRIRIDGEQVFFGDFTSPFEALERLDAIITDFLSAAGME